MDRFRIYYRLTKPGIIYGNLLSAGAGFFVAAQKHLYPGLFLATLAGIALVIASACVVNNYVDRGIDAKMERTKRRSLASGQVAARTAFIYAGLLGLAGFAALVFWTNRLTVAIGLAAYIAYVVLYGLAKRRSWLGTLVGSLPGAAPVVAGYTAVTGRLDSAALVLFLILVFWQMPHFYAIAIRRLSDYKAAGLPVLPIAKGIRAAKIQIMAFALAYAMAVAALTVLGYTGYFYLAVMGLYAFGWLVLAWSGFAAADAAKWATKMFLCSLVMLPLFFVTAPLDAWLR